MEIKKINFLLLCLLLCFLSISAWLISLTGNVWLTLIRDLLVLFFGLSALPSLMRQKQGLLSWVIIFAGFALLSVFWRDASFIQWLKGYRFIIFPILYFAVLTTVRFDDKDQQKASWLIWLLGIGIASLAIVQLIGINIPVLTAMSGSGSIDNVDFVGNLNIHRVHAILAGPNALGLYLFVLLSVNIGLLRNKQSQFWAKISTSLFIVALIGSFSRTGWVGFGLMYLIYFGYQMIKKISHKAVVASLMAGLIVAAGIGGYILSKKSTVFRELAIHGTSSSIRLDQYRRVWGSRFEIGLLGQGTGTAGPASQYRLDGGANNFTENVYLDIFQELGLIGLILYLIVLVNVWKLLRVLPSAPQGWIIKGLFLSFLVVGLFTNTYTGQVAVFTFWTVIGLALMSSDNKVIAE